MNQKAKKIMLGLSLILTFSVIGNVIFLFKFDRNESKANKALAMYIENDTGGYDLSNQASFPTDGFVLNSEKSSCRNGGSISQDSRTKKLSVSVTNKDECMVYFDIAKAPTASEILAYLNQSSNGVKTNFDEPATTDEGIFEMEDDYGTSYYFRGAVEDNYVKYGVNAAGKEMWWRIIRVNGDGSLRIVYDGTLGYMNGTSNEDRFVKTRQKYNVNYDDAKYIGWMYGPVGTTASTSKEQAQSNIASSDIKVYVDQWYKENIVDTGYGNNVSDEIFCNDRSIPGKVATLWASDTGVGFGSNYTGYGALGRFVTGKNSNSLSAKANIQPTFRCPQKNDAFTVDDIEKGNGALEYPVGLITADEIIAAGSGKYNTNNTNYYLYKSSLFVQWSLSPGYLSSSASIFIVGTGGGFNNTQTHNASGAVAPVINLSVEYASSMVGTGTITDPYRGREA